MAESENTIKDIHLLKSTRISVYVDEAVPDILVVTYEFGLQIFKGVLLDSTKQNLPCGVATLNPAFNLPTTTQKKDDDPLYSANQRFAYTDSTKPNKKLPIAKSNKMTVRLRPRQVLCSKCKGICNENSENVSRKRKPPDPLTTTAAPPAAAKRSIDAPVTRSVCTPPSGNKRKLRNQPVPTNFNKKILSSNINTENTQQHSSDNSDESSTSEEQSKRLPPRKKRSGSSMEELWDEEPEQQNEANSVSTTNTRTIKISYGPQGEGTVLKIPAQIENVGSDDSEENVDLKKDENKAARRALKRAKKEARRKHFLSTNSSPVFLGNGSPRYAMIGASSPRYTVGSASPRHGLGNNSPRYMCPSYEMNIPRRRKHKMKHKKKHRKDKESEVSSTQDDTKEQCITQKLSINLRRLNNTYATSSIGKIDEENSSSSDEHEVPDFPTPPVMHALNVQVVNTAPGADGSRLMLGDVVWGKIQGFPWWPGKILTISTFGSQTPQAHVVWYGSSTSSLMQCDQLSPYLDNFKIRYNKKKRGAYKEAIKQASLDAQENAENRVNRQPLGNSPSHNIIQVVQPALASPREIDVVS